MPSSTSSPPVALPPKVPGSTRESPPSTRPPRARFAWVDSPRTVRHIPAAVLLSLGLVQLLRHQSFWYDEAYSHLMAQQSFAAIVHGIVARVGPTDYLATVPPSFNGPYYLLLHLWSLIAGTSAFALRLPSLICAALACAVVAELVRRLAGSRAGLLAGLLTATGPLLFDQAVQARSYGMALLAVALCVLWLVQWLHQGKGLRRALVAAAVGALLHWFVLPVLAGLALFVLVRLRRQRRRGLLAALGLLVASLPAAALVGWALLGGAAGAPTPTQVGLALSWYALGAWSDSFAALSVSLVLAALVAVIWSRHRTLMLCWVVVPLAIVTVIDLVHPTYFARYLLFALVGLPVAAALGVARLRRSWQRWAAGAALLALSATAVVPQLSQPVREPAAAMVTALAQEHVSGQPIVAADGRAALDLQTYSSLAPDLADDLVAPPTEFTDQTTSTTVWLVRVVLHPVSVPVLPAEQRLLDAGWTRTGTTQLAGSNADLRIEQWTR